MIIGLTGGIGSGKTAVSDRFTALGITVVDADIASRVVVEPGRPALEQISAHFGSDILNTEGGLDRAQLRQIIFSDPAQKDWLEALLHPLIGEEILRQIETASGAYVVLASPLLLETSQHQLCDRILVVDVPEALQLQRTVKRDGNDPEQVQRIIASQMPRQSRLAQAHDVIVNDRGLKDLDEAVAKLHRDYLNIASTAETGV